MISARHLSTEYERLIQIMNRRHFLCWAATSSISLTRGTAETQLRDELSEKGMAVGRLGLNVLRIIPFDRSPMDRRYPLDHLDADGSFTRFWTWANGGSAVAFLLGDRASDDGQRLLVVDNAGKVSWQAKRMPLAPAFLPSPSPDGRRVAFVTRHPSVFKLWQLDESQALIEVASARIEGNPHLFGTTIGWSSDSIQNAVSWNRRIFLCGVHDKVELDLEGTNPAWSPDSRWISFEGSDSRLWVTEATGGKGLRLKSARRVIGSPSGVWSPDSRYILCNEEGTDNGTGPISEVVLYRLADGASLSLWNNRGISISDTTIVADWRMWVQRLPAA
jgi:hypothetical protein